jgi:hypothetical protein
MMVFSTGGCQCGQIRYSFSPPAGTATICHCRMCQKAFGNFGAALLNVPLTQFEWTHGTPGIFNSSAIVDRGFCANCGTPLYMHEHGDTNIELAIGTLDKPNDVPPFTLQSGIESKLSWFNTLAALPSERSHDSRTPEDVAKLRSLQQPD